MAIIQCVTATCKAELLAGIHAFDADTFKIALYGPSARIGPMTGLYTETGEVSGPGYVSGGATLGSGEIKMSGLTAWVSWENPEWTDPSFTATGALIYNATKDNRSVMAIAFSAPRIFSPSSPSLIFPQDGPSTALFRLT